MHAPNSRGLGGLLCHRAYLIALISNTFSRFGDSIDHIAFSWMVYQLTGSHLLMGSVFAVSGLPSLLFGFAAGVLVDRLPKKTVVVFGHLARALGVGLLLALYALGALESWMIFVLAFLNSTAEVFAYPAHTGLIQRIVSRDSYLAANSLSQSSASVAELAGLCSSGIVLAAAGVAGALALDAISFLAAAAGVSTVRIPFREEESVEIEDAAESGAAVVVSERKIGFLAELKAGLAFVWGDRLLRITAFLAVFASLSLVPFEVLQPAFVKDVLGAGPAGMSVLGIGLAVGMALGGIALARYGSGAKRLRLILTGFLVVGVQYACLALPGLFSTISSRLAAAAVVAFFTGAGLPLVNATIGAYLMEKTPRRFIGRTTAVLNVAATGAVPLGAALSGAAAEIVSIPVIFIALGAVLVGVALFASSRPAVRKELASPRLLEAVRVPA